MREEEFLEYGRMHISALKSQKAFRDLTCKWALGSYCKWLTMLVQLCHVKLASFGLEVGTPWQNSGSAPDLEREPCGHWRTALVSRALTGFMVQNSFK